MQATSPWETFDFATDIDVGGCELIINGNIKVKQGSEISAFILFKVLMKFDRDVNSCVQHKGIGV